MFHFFFPFVLSLLTDFYQLIILAFILLREFRSLHIFKLVSLLCHCTCIYKTLYEHSNVCRIRNLSFVLVFIREQILSYPYL